MSTRSLGKPLRAKRETTLTRLRATLDAIPSSQVQHVNLDVPQAVAMIARSMPRIRQLQPRMLLELPLFDLTLLENLPVYASALAEASAHAAAK